MALRDRPYLPLFVQDFLTDERLSECSAESHGVYIRLMCLMHKSEEYGTILLKQKDKQIDKQNASKVFCFATKLARLMPFDVATIERSLMELLEEKVLTIDGDVLFQKRMVRDGKLSDTRASAGSKGGKTKISSDFASPFASGFATAKTQANPEYEIEYENEDESVGDIENEMVPSRARISAIEKRFNEFWAAYPRKVGKGGAQKVWSKIKPTAELHAKILAAVDIAKRSVEWQKDNGKFIPHPTTWLNQGRWDDELTPAKKGATASSLQNVPTEEEIGRRKRLLQQMSEEKQ